MTSRGVVSWEDPPSARRAPEYDWQRIAQDLKSRPGVWAHVVTCTSAACAGTVARNVRRSAYNALAGHRYAAKSRTVAGEFRVYAMYLGPAE